MTFTLARGCYGQVKPAPHGYMISSKMSSYVVASTDETAQVLPYPPSEASTGKVSSISHPAAVRCILPLALSDLGEPYLLTGSGDAIRAFDLSSPGEPEALGEIDAHWHDVTSLRLWVRRTAGEDGKTRVEPWVVSASLDGTIRKWQLSGERLDAIGVCGCHARTVLTAHPLRLAEAGSEEACGAGERGGHEEKSGPRVCIDGG
jgi:WD40 repeat protein